MKKVLVYLAVPLVYALHQDTWFWHDSEVFLGLPIGLTYQVAYCGLASLLMFCLIRAAWPSHLEIEAAETQAGKGGPWH
jgi:hypothetical protein